MGEAIGWGGPAQKKLDERVRALIRESYEVELD